MLEASPDRATPPCRHFGVCGGCHYQHAEYAAQLAMKTGILHETLERAGLRELPEIDVHSAEPLQYRNRIRLQLVLRAEGIVFGYKQAGSHAVVAIEECPIAAPLLLQTAAPLVALADGSQESFALLSGCGEMELFCNADETELQLSLYQREEDSAAAENFGELCEMLKEQAPQLAGAGLYAPQKVAGKQRDEPSMRQIANWGANTLRYQVGGFRYRVSRGAFFQVNRFIAEELVRHVCEARSGDLAWDLYAGVGLFSVALRHGFKQVLAVEVASPSNKDLAYNLAQSDAAATKTTEAKSAGAKAVAATTLDFLRGQLGATNKKGSGQHASVPGLIVLDPPRAGLGPDVCALLGKIAAPELVYVSCDPATLSRDLAALIESGYQLRQLHMVDMFPQTFHLETVAVLVRT